MIPLSLPRELHEDLIRNGAQCVGTETIPVLLRKSIIKNETDHLLVLARPDIHCSDAPHFCISKELASSIGIRPRENCTGIKDLIPAGYIELSLVYILANSRQDFARLETGTYRDN